MTEWEISGPDRAILHKLIPRTHASQRKVLRKEIPIHINSICRPLSKPPDKQYSLESEINKKISPYMNLIYRPPLPSLLTYKIPMEKEERIGILEKEIYPMQNQTTDPLQNPLAYPNCQGYYY